LATAFWKTRTVPESGVRPRLTTTKLVAGNWVGAAPKGRPATTRALFSPEALPPPSMLMSRLSSGNAPTPAAGTTWKVSSPPRPTRVRFWTPV
jgi:hypothetical protein